MKYLKGFGLVLLGFITGVIATQYLFVESTARYIEAENDFRSVLSNSLETTTEKRLREQRLIFLQAQSLFESYKNGDDIADYLFKSLDKMEKGLSNISLALVEEISPELNKAYMQQLAELGQLEEDLKFYLGPSS